VAKVIDICELEREEYQGMEREIGARIIDTEETIRRLEIQLEQEKVLRKHKQLLEKLAGLLMFLLSLPVLSVPSVGHLCTP